MKIKIMFLILCPITFISCKKHVCSCTEYLGDTVVQAYEKSLSNALTCEDLSTYIYDSEDTIHVVCGETNPL